MALDLQAKEKLAAELAYHLSWEFWMTDHASVTQVVLDRLYPNGVPDEPPEATGKKVKAALEQERAWWKKIWKEKSTDTAAVGISRDGKEIVIAANLKKRSEKVIRGKDTTYSASEFSLHDGRHEEAIQRACDTFPQTRWTNISVLVPEQQPHEKEENARLHAEMQIVKYALHQHLDIEVIGISKPACSGCAQILLNKGISHVHNPDELLSSLKGPIESQNKKVTNWADPTEGEFGGVNARARIQQFRLLKSGEDGIQVVR